MEQPRHGAKSRSLEKDRPSKIIVRTPKLRSVEVPQKTSPITPRSTTRNSTSGTLSQTPVSRSPKVIEGQSPQSPLANKKHQCRVSELESQVSQLQKKLNKTKDQLSSSEAWKKRVQKEAEEAKEQLNVMSTTLDYSRHQLAEFTAAEEARLGELCKISQERDRAWQSELEAVQKQHFVDSATLSCAMNEIQRLKVQLEMVLKSEAANLKHSETASTELQSLKHDMAETLVTIENIKIQIKDSNKAEAEALTTSNEIQEHLKVVRTTTKTCSSEGSELRESSSSTAFKLEELTSNPNSVEGEDHDELETIKPSSSETEVEQLRSALETAEIKYQEEKIQNVMQIQSAYELLECVKSDSGFKESQLKLALKNAKSEITQLKANLVDKEAALQSITDANEELNKEIGVHHAKQMQSELESKLMKSVTDITELKAGLMDKETELQIVMEENERLNAETGKRESENHKGYEAVIAELELAKAREQDAILRLGRATEEADNNNRKAMRALEQLDATRAINLEMEAELKRLRIQSDQWRRAAEAAAAVLTTSDNGRLSWDSDYNSTAGKFMGSPLSDELDDESPVKKSKNVLKKIGGFWKKSPK